MLDLDPEKMLEAALQKAKDCFTVGELEYGQEILEQLLRCDPNHQAAIQLLGVFHHRCRRYAAATPLFARAIELDPTNADNYNNLALCQTSLGDPEAAVTNLLEAVRLNPSESKYFNNLAIQYRHLRRYGAAEAALNRALEIDPKNTQIWSNLGGVRGETHRLNEAETAYAAALSIDPDMASAHVDLAYTYSLQGRFAEAWTHYEYRFAHFDNLRFYNHRYDPDKRWKIPTTDLSGKTVLLYCEQGLGDAVQFARYLPLLRESKGCRVVLHCSDVLKPLFEASSLGVDEFFTTPIVAMNPGDAPPHDHHASLMSLPYLLGSENFLSRPYLGSTVRANLGHGDDYKIGICWAGSPQHPNDSTRSCHLRRFKPLHDLPGVKLFSLQQNINPRVYAHLPNKPVDYTEGVEDMRLVDLSGYMTDFLQTSNLIEDLDLVVTVDTALLHLAGGKGVDSIGLIAYNPDWRWGIKGETTPWYDRMTLIRQERFGDWDGVFQKLVEKVKNRK
jgi:tetratricopeptide (TPR) repeat protein